jgi:hypothetical protein
VAFDRAASAKWAAILVESGASGERPAAELRLTRAEAVALARLLDREGFVEKARRSASA